MKKIMFSERYGLQQAVLEGRKTMTRRLVPCSACNSVLPAMKYNDLTSYYDFVIEKHRHFDIGEEVAIAQRYEQIYLGFSEPRMRHDFGMRVSTVHHNGDLHNIAGWTNKMFVKANLMPNRIRITGIKVERLQDISDEDAMREGIHEGEFMNTRDRYYYDEWGDVPNHITFKTPRLAFQSLIDKVSGKWTWASNPFVFAYEFELLTNE